MQISFSISQGLTSIAKAILYSSVTLNLVLGLSYKWGYYINTICFFKVNKKVANLLLGWLLLVATHHPIDAEFVCKHTEVIIPKCVVK